MSRTLTGAEELVLWAQEVLLLTGMISTLYVCSVECVPIRKCKNVLGKYMFCTSAFMFLHAMSHRCRIRRNHTQKASVQCDRNRNPTDFDHQPNLLFETCRAMNRPKILSLLQRTHATTNNTNQSLFSQ